MGKWQRLVPVNNPRTSGSDTRNPVYTAGAEDASSGNQDFPPGDAGGNPAQDELDTTDPGLDFAGLDGSYAQGDIATDMDSASHGGDANPKAAKATDK